MLKRYFRRIAPHPDTLQKHQFFSRFAHLLHDPNLWHFNRHSVARAFGAGLFAAFLPFPFQSPFAAALAIWLRGNLPLAVLMVFITNPLTMVPIELSAYWLGQWVVPGEFKPLPNPFEWGWVWDNLYSIGLPIVIGHFMLSVLGAILGYFGIQGLWRIYIAMHLNKRKKRVYSSGNPQAGVHTAPIESDHRQE
ncbi:MAG: DUF2062 domain-containing protein [Halothiobacillaceae bacterium]